MYANHPYTEPIKRAVGLVMSRQLPVGCLVPVPVSHSNVIFRMAHGHRRPSKGSAV